MPLPLRVKLSGGVLGDLDSGSCLAPVNERQSAPAKTRLKQNRVGVGVEEHVKIHVNE